MNSEQIFRHFLETILDIPSRQKWTDPLSFLGCHNRILLFGSPDPVKTAWLYHNLLERVNAHFRENHNLSVKIVPLYDEDSPSMVPASSGNPLPDPGSVNTLHHNENSNLLKKYTFENFVQWDSNRMAYSFSFSVSEYPGKSYNPLYIYSDVGLGKTHLLYAIGNRIIDTHPGMKVIYLTTSDLMNEYVEYSRLSKRPEFLKKYTDVDVLLVDDIQNITKWGGTSEQFYYIFNKLIQMEKQIVLCSDKHPDNIPDLENRIKSRFEWGGIVDILPYDLEGRLVILKKKLEERSRQMKHDFKLSDDVFYFLASSIKENIRRLEGALNRLLGVADLKLSNHANREITLDFAKEALKPYISINKKNIGVSQILEMVAQKYGLKSDDLISRTNQKKIVFPRQIAMYLSKNLTSLSLKEIGEAMGGKDHSTVLHGIRKIEKAISDDPDISRDVKNLSNLLGAQ